MVGELAIFFFFFKQKTAYEMRISDWSSDVCSSDLRHHIPPHLPSPHLPSMPVLSADFAPSAFLSEPQRPSWCALASSASMKPSLSVSISSNIPALSACAASNSARETRSEEHTSELQSLMRISYAVFCLKKKTHN